MQAKAVHRHSVIETLDAVDRLYVARVEAEAASFELAAHFADLHPGEVAGPGVDAAAGSGACGAVGGSGDAVGVGVRGGRAGGADADGDLVGAALSRGCVGGAASVAVVVGAGGVAGGAGRQCPVGGVPDAAALAGGGGVCGSGDGRGGGRVVAVGRFEALLEGVVVAADPVAAAVREEERALVQFAKRTRASEAGTAGFYVRSTVGVIARVEASVLFVAEALRAFGDVEDLDARKVKAVVVLCNPTRAVELLAGYAALRARTVDVELPLADEPPPDDRLTRRPADDRLRISIGPVPATRWTGWMPSPAGSGSPPAGSRTSWRDRSTASRSRPDDGPPDPARTTAGRTTARLQGATRTRHPIPAPILGVPASSSTGRRCCRR